MSTADDNNQRGIFMENGSGGFMSDLVFQGGAIGAFFGNQQFTVRDLSFNNCQVAVNVLWDWAWTMMGISITGGQIGFNVTANGGGNGASQTQGVGSMLVTDSTLENIPVAVLSQSPMVANLTSLMLENVQLTNVGAAVLDDDTGAVLLAGGRTTITTWGLGDVYSSSEGATRFQAGGYITPQQIKPEVLGGGTSWFSLAYPYYSDILQSLIVNVKLEGAVGDGVTDDTGKNTLF